MSERDAVEAELRELGSGVDQQGSDACRKATSKLLRRLSSAQALEVARQQVERSLPAFERHQPGVTWPRDFLESLRVPDPLGEGGREWPWREDEFAGPGANNFIKALNNVWEARQLEDGPRRLEMLVDAINDAVLSEMVEAWGARHPEEWRRWLWRGPDYESHPDRGRIQATMMTAPETLRLKRAGWLYTADRLAEALGVSSPSAR